MKSRRRLLAACASAAALALMLAACSGAGKSDASSSAGGKTTLTFLAPEYSDKTAPYWKSLIASFEKENPDITINLQTIAWTDINTKINTLVSTGEQPDILNLDSYVSFAADDLLLPAKDVLPAGTYDDIVPSLLTNATYKGTTYGIPFIASARALFYNKDLAAKAGITAAPTTWDELAADAKKIKDATGQIGYGLPFGSPEAFGEYSIWMWNNGGDWKNGDTWTINSAKNVESLKAAAALYKAGVTQESPWTTNRDDLFKMFSEGKVGIVEGAAFLPAVMKGYGSTVDYAVAPSPTNGGAAQATLAVEDYLMVFKSTKNKAAAGKFLQYFYQAENYKTFLQNEGMLPVTKTSAEAMKSDPVAGPFVSMLDSAKFYPTTDPNWPSVSQEAVAKLGLAISGQEDPQKVLDDLQAHAEAQG